MLIPCYELRLLNTIIVLCSSANYVLLLLFPISCYLDSLNMAWKCSPCNLMARSDYFDHKDCGILVMVMVNFGLTIWPRKFSNYGYGHGQLWGDHFDHKNCGILTWSWSTLDWPYDHGNYRIMAMVMVNFFWPFWPHTLTQAKWSKNRGRLTPPPLTCE